MNGCPATASQSSRSTRVCRSGTNAKTLFGSNSFASFLIPLANGWAWANLYPSNTHMMCHQEVEVSRSSKIDRARRNTLRAASLVLGAVLAAGTLHKQALAAPDWTAPLG